MSPLLLVSIALLLGSLIATIALWTRSGETRVGLFGGLFAVLAIHQSVELWSHWGEPFAVGATAATALASVVISAIGVGVVVALWRTLGERDRAEVLHWDSMEAVRIMNELSSNERMPFDEKVAKLLQIGSGRYGLEVGMLSRINKDRFEVLAVRCPKDFPVARGAVFALGETFCANTLESERPIAVEQITASSWTGRLDRAAFPFDAYLGASIRVGGLPYGTLSFGDRTPRKVRFTSTDKDLVRLMAQWLGNEIERRDGVHTYVEDPIDAPASEAEVELDAAAEMAQQILEQTPPRRAAPPPPPPKREAARRVIDANKVLRRFEKDLRNAAGENVEFSMKLDPSLGLAAVQRVPLDAIARTLVMNARDAMPDGGELVIETANLELMAGEPGVIPAVAPDRYVTIAVHDTGTEPDADTLSRLYDSAPESDSTPHVRDPTGRLALSTVYRVLQACGGDLSVDVEPGRGSTFTVYLPRAADDVARDRDEPSDAAAESSPENVNVPAPPAR